MILATIAITLLLALVLVNLAGAEHKVQKQIDHLYKVDDEQFTRAMGLMMGPTIVQGNQVRELNNGDQIFPIHARAAYPVASST